MLDGMTWSRKASRLALAVFVLSLGAGVGSARAAFSAPGSLSEAATSDPALFAVLDVRGIPTGVQAASVRLDADGRRVLGLAVRCRATELTARIQTRSRAAATSAGRLSAAAARRGRTCR